MMKVGAGGGEAVRGLPATRTMFALRCKAWDRRRGRPVHHMLRADNVQSAPLALLVALPKGKTQGGEVHGPQ